MKFTARSTAEQVTQGLDLTGKTAVITGVSSGLGFETMRVLCMRGARVIGLARTLEKAEQACASVSGATLPLACELGDWGSVREAALAIREIDSPVDMLICNAGMISTKKITRAHGLEMQFATNHIGHFILTHHLMDQIKRAPQGRAVLVSSFAHRAFSFKGGIDFDNLDAHARYSPFKFYGQSKLANLLHTKGLAARLEGTGATANAVDPGVVRTGLGRDGGIPLMTAMMLITRPLQKNIPQGAATQCLVATRPELAGDSGKYFAHCKEARHSPLANDEALIEKLWRYSEEVAAPYLR